MSRERQEAGPSDTYLTEADGEEGVWDAFTTPLRRLPAGAQSQQLQNQISTHPPTPEHALRLWQEETEQ